MQTIDLKKRSTLTILLLLLVSLFNQGISTDQAMIEKQKGITLTSWSGKELLTPDAELSIEHIRSTGANWVSIIATQYQETIHTTEIKPRPNTPTREALTHAIQTARAQGLKVMLKPHVDLSNDPLHWRAEIGASFTDEEWREWFSSYREMIMEYARFAEEHEVEQFAVGTELQKASPHASFWRSLIYDIRQVYSGKLTYAANHSGEEFFLSWWDALDYIGIDAYYPLSVRSNPTLTEMELAWRQFLIPLRGLYNTWRKPILFTELGYRSNDGTTQRPYEYHTNAMEDPGEQAMAYQAFFSQVFWQPWFAGVHWWAWDPNPFTSGQCGNNYTPFEKAAEDVLRVGFGGLPRLSLPPLEPNENLAYPVYFETLNADWADVSWAQVNQDAIVPTAITTTAHVYGDDRSIRVEAAPGDALAFHFSAGFFDTRLFSWIDLIVQTDSPQDWRVRLVDSEAQSPRSIPINNCRYLPNGWAGPDSWQKVRIPLDALLSENREVSSILLVRSGGRSQSPIWLNLVQFVPNW